MSPRYNEGPEIKAKGTLWQWVQGLGILAILAKSFFPVQATTPAQEEIKLAPIYSALNDLKVSMATITEMIRQQGSELADHEQRLRGVEGWPSQAPAAKPAIPPTKP